MKITDRIKKFMNRNNPELIAGNVADAYLERKENGEKDPMDHTVEEIMQILKTHPDIEKAILANIFENEKIPDRIFEKVATRISKDEEIPDSVIPEAVNRADTSISMESINNIIENGEVNARDRIELIKQVEDTKSKKQGVKSELKRLYKDCEQKRDAEVTGRIGEITKILSKEDIDQDIQGWIQTVIARKMAENFYSEIKQGTKIFTFTTIEPLEDMIEKDIATDVENEYRKIEEERQPKKGRFNKEEFETQLYKELGKQIGIKYEDTGVFIIPQSKNIKKMDEEQKTKFIKSIQTYARRPLTKEEIIDIDEQRRGVSENSQIKESTIIKKIKELPKDGKNDKIDMLTEILQNPKMYETIKQLQESGLLNELEKLPKEKREKTMKVVNSTINKREKYKVAKNTPQIKGARFSEKPTIDGESR